MGLSKESSSHKSTTSMPLLQWMLRITAYADRLLEDLEGLEWDENIKDMQRNWIGKSEGAMVSFQIQGVLLRFYLLRQYKVACTAFEL